MTMAICQIGEKAYGVGLDEVTAKELATYCKKSGIHFSQDALREAIIVGVQYLYAKVNPAPPESEVKSGVGKEASSNNGN